MKLFWLAYYLVVTTLTSATIANSLESAWKHFKSTYGKVYGAKHEEKVRKANFAENFKKIAEHNKRFEQGLETYSLKINHFADYNNKEFRSKFTGLKRRFREPNDMEVIQFVPDPNAVVPDEFDWRQKGAVTEVKSQEDCGSCWTFGATGTLEGQYFLKTGKLVSLSEQNLLDCIPELNCDTGGFPEYAYAYIYDNDGIDSEKSYPYEAIKGNCRYSVDKNVTSIKGYGQVEEGNEVDLKAAVATVGPIATGIDARDLLFQFYGSGVYNNKKCRNETECLNHAVLIVGYGTEENGDDYWLIKNSWSRRWGEQGYGKVPRNKDNMCGIALKSTYPLNY